MNSILLRLIKIHIFLINGRFVRTQIMKTPTDTEREVIIFSGDKTIFLGQCTPFRTIIIHESLLNNERLSNYVLIHEMAHTKQWWSVFAIPLGFLVICSLFSLAWAFASLIQLLISMNPIYLIGFMWGVIISALSLVIPCAFSWVMELNADFAAIGHIGLQAFMEIREDLRKMRKPTLSSIIIGRLTHPTIRITACVWCWFHKRAGNR